MSVNTHLSEIASALILSDTEKSGIEISITTIKSRLNAYFGANIKEHFTFGSYTRVTILPRSADENSDIDYMVVFDTSDGIKTPQTYLSRLKNFAEVKYQSSEIYQSTPTIVLSLNHIKFELVPAVIDNGYKIPAPKNTFVEWISTAPRDFNTKLTDKNTSNNYYIKPLVRLIKYWNVKNNYPYYSFSLENYIVESYFYNCLSLKDYFYTFWENFNCVYSEPQVTKDKVSRAKTYSKQAKEYERDNKPVAAESEIKKVVPPL